MTSKYQKFFAINSIVVGVCYVAYTTVVKKYNEKIYKRSIIFKEAMETLKSHRGAVHFLGEFIEDGNLKVLNEEKEGNKTTYHVKVAVSGCAGGGNMHFWLSRDGEDSDAELSRIELQLHKIKKRLLILDRNKSQKAEFEILNS